MSAWDSAEPGPHRVPRFVGRRQELQVLDGLLTDAAAGGSPAVAVVGEPGIGKTRLTEQLAAGADGRGFQVLSGRGSEFEQDVPFGLAIDALDEQVGSLPAEVLARLGSEWGAELAAVFPSMAGAGRPLASPLQIERFRGHYAVRAVLTRLAKMRPVLLVLDDLHWADPASLELVAHLLRRGVRASMLVLVHRSHTGLEATGCGRAARNAGIPTLELGPLPVADLASAIGDHPDSATVKALYAESGGNPFYFSELAKAPTRPDAAALAAGRTDPALTAPSAVRAAIDRELTALSPDARQLVQAAAVIGDPFDVDLTAAVAGLTDDQALTALDELVASTIVGPNTTPERMVFRHPIVRHAVYDGIGHGSRLGAHRRAAAELAARGGPIGARAHHVERSARPGDPDAIALLDEAGHATAPRAPSAAARWFAGAVRLLPPDTAPARRLDLLLPLAAAHAAAGHPDASRNTLETARSHVAPDDVATRVRIISQLATAEQAVGRTERAKQLLTEALSQTEADTAEAVALTVELATAYIVLGEWAQAARVATQATEMAEHLGDRALLAAAAVANGSVLLAVEESALEATRWVHQASELLAELPDDALAVTGLPTLATLAMLETQSRDWRPAERHAERGLRISRRWERGDVYLPLLLVQCATRIMRGDLDEAGPVTDAAAEAAALLDNDQWIAPIEGERCWMFGLQGRMAKALAAGRNAVRAAERAPRSMYWWAACSLNAWALLEAGRHAEGRKEFERVGGSMLYQVPVTSRPYWLNALVRSYVATGELATAQELVDRMERTEAEAGQLLYHGEACDARASLLLASGQDAAAARAAHEAIENYEARELPIDAAQARILAGRALVANGRAVAGKTELLRAHEVLTRCGAARMADQAARELRALGVRVASRSRPRGAGDGVHALTDRERDVAELAAQGHTNRQIAETLFVTPKTVEAHLARVYTKLGVHSRAAMAARLALAGERDH